jgi:hypothetical protein
MVDPVLGAPRRMGQRGCSRIVECHVSQAMSGFKNDSRHPRRTDLLMAITIVALIGASLLLFIFS